MAEAGPEEAFGKTDVEGQVLATTCRSAVSGMNTELEGTSRELARPQRWVARHESLTATAPGG